MQETAPNHRFAHQVGEFKFVSGAGNLIPKRNDCCFRFDGTRQRNSQDSLAGRVIGIDRDAVHCNGNLAAADSFGKFEVEMLTIPAYAAADSLVVGIASHYGLNPNLLGCQSAGILRVVDVDLQRQLAGERNGLPRRLCVTDEIEAEKARSVDLIRFRFLPLLVTVGDREIPVERRGNFNSGLFQTRYSNFGGIFV